MIFSSLHLLPSLVQQNLLLGIYKFCHCEEERRGNPYSLPHHNIMKTTLFWLLFTVLLRWSWSFACTISPQTKEQKFENAQLVVSWKITAKANLSQNPQIFWDNYNQQLQFTIYEIHKGALSGNMITLLNDSNSTCGTNNIRSGRYYTFYLYDNTNFHHFPAYGISSLNTYARQPPTQDKPSLRNQIINFFNNLY